MNDFLFFLACAGTVIVCVPILAYATVYLSTAAYYTARIDYYFRKLSALRAGCESPETATKG